MSKSLSLARTLDKSYKAWIFYLKENIFVLLSQANNLPMQKDIEKYFN